MKKTKIVSPIVRLQALALFTLANQNYLRAEAYDESLAELLGYDADLTTSFLEEWLKKSANFDKAFKDAGFIVRKSKVKKAKRKK